MRLTGEGRFDGTTFHRMVRHDIVQGGDPLTADPARAAPAAHRPRGCAMSGPRQRPPGKRPCRVPGCMARVRVNLGAGDRCGDHAPETARLREAADVRRARARLQAAMRRMA